MPEGYRVSSQFSILNFEFPLTLSKNRGVRPALRIENSKLRIRALGWAGESSIEYRVSGGWVENPKSEIRNPK